MKTRTIRLPQHTHSVAPSISEYDPDLYVFSCGHLYSLGLFEYLRGSNDPLPAIHFITRGCGKFKFKDLEFEAKAGDVVIVPPYTPCEYHDYPNQPWRYYWFKLSGHRHKEILAKILPPAQPYHLPQILTGELIAGGEIINAKLTSGNYPEFYPVSAAWEVINLLKIALSGECHDQTDNAGFAEACRHYIDENFSAIRSMHDLENIFNVHRTTIYRNFIAAFKDSPYNYLLRKKLEMATDVLEKTNLTIKEVAAVVGYTDANRFSRVFREKYGLSPRDWRKQKS